MWIQTVVQSGIDAGAVSGGQGEPGLAVAIDIFSLQRLNKDDTVADIDGRATFVPQEYYAARLKSQILTGMKRKIDVFMRMTTCQPG